MFRIAITATATAAALALTALPALAQQAPPPAAAEAAATPTATPRVGITAKTPEVSYTTPQGEAVTIARDQTPGATLSGDWALTGQNCPPFCIQPMSPAPGVTTVGELELLEAMKAGETTLVDGRTPDWYSGGTIPGAINIPYTQAVERLAELGCEPDFDGKFDCSNAHKVIMFCNGAWCGQSPTAIRSMLEAGYPADRISYYRGGMLEWRLLGLSVAGGKAAASADPAAAATNPVTEGTTEAATTGAAAPAPVEGEATAATPMEGEKPADTATIDNAAKAGQPATPMTSAPAPAP